MFTAVATVLQQNMIGLCGADSKGNFEVAITNVALEFVKQIACAWESISSDV
jgi:hypothetical protein